MMNERFIFELAAPEDNGEICDILEAGSFKGNISLLYTRRPNALASFAKEGKDVDVFICRDTKENKIAALGACAINQHFINGKVCNLGYLFALRQRQEYQRSFRILNRGYDFIWTRLVEHQTNFCISTILDDNEAAVRLFEKPRKFMPIYSFFGHYHTHVIKTGLRLLGSGGLKFRRAQPSDANNICSFLQQQGQRFQFFPALSPQELTDTESARAVPRIEDFFLVLDSDDSIVAAGAAWDQRAYKQYRVSGYSGILRLLYPLSFVFPVFGYPALTKINSIANFFTLSFWAVKDNCPDIFRFFLSHLSTIHSHYCYFTLGLHDAHPLRLAMKKMPSFCYRSRLYLVYREDLGGKPVLDDSLVPYLECARL